MYTKEKPGTPEEILEHHGVKGMRWGVRTKASRSFNAKNPTRAQRNQAIKKARYNVDTGKSVSRADAAAALRLTTGEKVAVGILASTGFLTIPLVAYTGTRVAMRRAQEKRA